MKINSSDRITMSKKPIDSIRSISSQKVAVKPAGMWYGIGNSWITWVTSEMPDWVGKYIYKLTINGNVLKITSVEQFNAFNRKFGTMKDYTSAIDWSRVASEYDGIEISPYRSEKRMIGWYYPWDIASGCVWNHSAVSKIELIDK